MCNYYNFSKSTMIDMLAYEYGVTKELIENLDDVELLALLISIEPTEVKTNDNL